jgi:hypothetical protein
MYLCATEGIIQQLMHTSCGCALRLKASSALSAQHRYSAGLRVHVSSKGAAADGQQPPSPLRVQAVPVLLLQLLWRQCRFHASQLTELCHQIGPHTLRAKSYWVTGKTMLLCIGHQPGAVCPKDHLRAANFFEAVAGVGRIRAFCVGHIPLRLCAKEQWPHVQILHMSRDKIP